MIVIFSLLLSINNIFIFYILSLIKIMPPISEQKRKMGVKPLGIF